MASPEARLPEVRGGFRSLLGHRDFLLIWLGQLAAQLADKFLMFSLIILAYNLSGGSTQVAITLLAYTVPAVAIAPLAGVVADRYDRKVIMVLTNLVRAAIIALIPLTSLIPELRNDYVHLLVITFAFAAVGQLFGPAEAAAIPTVLPRSLLVTANSMVLVTMGITLVVGAPLAPIVSRLDIYAPYWIAVALFVFAGGMVLLARIPRLARKPRTEKAHPFKQVAIELKEGMEALGRSPVLLISFYQLSLAVLVMFMMFTLAPAYVSQVVGIADQDAYLVLVPATAGALASAIVIGQLGRRLSKSRLLLSALIATGMTLLLLAAIPSILGQLSVTRPQLRWVAAGFSFLLGLEFGSMMIPALSYLMEQTGDDVRGRIFALLYMVVNGVTAVPVLVAAALSDLVGTNRVIGGLGILVAGTGLVSARYASRLFGSARIPD